jgi:6-phosphofructokinase 1
MLADVVKAKMGVKVRGIELSLLQRCGSHLASKTYVEEAYLVGKTAVEAAVSGMTDHMVGLDCVRDENGYHCKAKLVPLSEAANTERKVPREWINAEGNNVEQGFIDYALPLVQGETIRPLENGLPRFAKLKKVLTTEMD